MSDKPLTKKQQRFVDEYCVDWNASRAARAAGYSEKTAQAMGAENLTKPVIKAAIQAKADELARRADFDAEFVRRELKRQYEETRDSDQRQHPIKCLEIMSRVQGMHQHDQNVNIRGRIIINRKK